MLQVGGAAAGRCQLADTHSAISHGRRAGFDFVLLIFFQIKYLTQLFPRQLFGHSHASHKFRSI